MAGWLGTRRCMARKGWMDGHGWMDGWHCRMDRWGPSGYSLSSGRTKFYLFFGLVDSTFMIEKFEFIQLTAL